jgi:cyclopropane-fatty-acyl-phospholipid synthase
MVDHAGETATTEFFTRVLGGKWHVYSTGLWEGASSETAAQERKLDLLAELMRLGPGARVLDVGSGWGGPLTYLGKRYGARGVGISLLPQQREYANARAQRENVPVEFMLSHWRDFVTEIPFDAVVTCGVVVHFPDLHEYFARAKQWLKPGGVIVNEEMHFLSEDTRLAWTREQSRAMTFLSELRRRGRAASERLSADEEGEYLTLDQELATARRAGLEVQRVVSIPLTEYQKTVQCWIDNCERQQPELEVLVGGDRYRSFRAYFKLFRRLIDERAMQLDIVTARRPERG